MPRLRSIHSGAVVSVSAETAARLGDEWQPVKEEPKAPAKKAPAKPASK